MKKIFLIFLFCLVQPAYSQTLNIEEVQKIALSESPRIKAMEAETQMMKKRIPQSDALEDPKLKLGINNLPLNSLSFTKEDMTSKEIGISQMIPLGKLGYKKSIAEKEYEKAAVKLKAEKVETLYMLRMYIYEIIYTRSSIKIMEDIKRQIKLVIDSEIAASKSGLGSLSNVIKAKTEFDMADEEIISLEQKRKEFEQKINYLTGKKIEINIDKLPEPNFKDVSIETINKEIASSNSQLKMLLIDTEISRNEISLKKSEYIPDVDIGVSYMQRQNSPEGMKRDDMVSGMIIFNIPVWSWKKNMNMVDEMSKKNESAKNLYQDKLNDMKARAEILVSQLVKWKDLHKLYKEKLIPQTELGLETVLSRYRTSSVEFMPVIDSVRMLLRYRKELLMTKKEYNTSYSELHALLGQEILP
jgi:cobalt-zinc-cadmium efflux system outer membrane protein